MIEDAAITEATRRFTPGSSPNRLARQRARHRPVRPPTARSVPSPPVILSLGVEICSRRYFVESMVSVSVPR